MQTRTMSSDEIERAVAQIVRKHLGQEYRIFLFGSRAKGTARRGSDYDIGIEGPVPVPASIKFDIEDDLEKLPTLATIEIVDFSQASERFARSAARSARDI